MEKLIIYPSNEKQATALKSVLQEMQIDYKAISEDEIEEVEDDELLNAMKETEGEEPLSDVDQVVFLNWVKQQS